MTIRVLVADDQELVRTGLRTLLESGGDIEVVAEAADGAEAIALARELRPDVCLMDIRMPGTDGLAATEALAGPTVADPIPRAAKNIDFFSYLRRQIESGTRLDSLPCTTAGRTPVVRQVSSSPPSVERAVGDKADENRHGDHQAIQAR